jgi:hypothetical protein
VPVPRHARFDGVLVPTSQYKPPTEENCILGRPFAAEQDDWETTARMRVVGRRSRWMPLRQHAHFLSYDTTARPNLAFYNIVPAATPFFPCRYAVDTSYIIEARSAFW